MPAVVNDWHLTQRLVENGYFWRRFNSKFISQNFAVKFRIGPALVRVDGYGQKGTCAVCVRVLATERLQEDDCWMLDPYHIVLSLDNALSTVLSRWHQVLVTAHAAIEPMPRNQVRCVRKSPWETHLYTSQLLEVNSALHQRFPIEPASIPQFLHIKAIITFMIKAKVWRVTRRCDSLISRNSIRTTRKFLRAVASFISGQKRPANASRVWLPGFIAR